MSLSRGVEQCFSPAVAPDSGGSCLQLTEAPCLWTVSSVPARPTTCHAFPSSLAPHGPAGSGTVSETEVTWALGSSWSPEAGSAPRSEALAPCKPGLPLREDGRPDAPGHELRSQAWDPVDLPGSHARMSSLSPLTRSWPMETFLALSSNDPQSKRETDEDQRAGTEVPFTPGGSPRFSPSARPVGVPRSQLQLFSACPSRSCAAS